MARKKKCVECRHCRTVPDPKKGEGQACSCKKVPLSGERASGPACDKFELPEAASHWGP